jgi:hypothetical protein
VGGCFGAVEETVDLFELFVEHNFYWNIRSLKYRVLLQCITKTIIAPQAMGNICCDDDPQPHPTMRHLQPRLSNARTQAKSET